MAKEKNPLWVKKGSRLNQIKKWEGLSNRDLADVLHLEYTTTSHVLNGSKNLTDSNAKGVIKKYPKYRLEWLTGKDDYPTEQDRYNAYLLRANEEEKKEITKIRNMETGINALGLLSGYEIELDCKGKQTVDGQYNPLDSDVYLIDKSTNVGAYLSYKNFERIANHISEIVGLILKNEYESAFNYVAERDNNPNLLEEARELAKTLINEND